MVRTGSGWFLKHIVLCIFSLIVHSICEIHLLLHEDRILPSVCFSVILYDNSTHFLFTMDVSLHFPVSFHCFFSKVTLSTLLSWLFLALTWAWCVTCLSLTLQSHLPYHFITHTPSRMLVAVVGYHPSPESTFRALLGPNSLNGWKSHVAPKQSSSSIPRQVT